MRVAVVGCGHGELDRIYASIKLTEERTGFPVDFVVICGDFQAIRHDKDLATIACPEKYLALGSFPAIYSGQKEAPYPTLFIGGNHEASAYLWELYHGGWAAKNIFFLGAAGVIKVNGIRFGGLSGIYKHRDYRSGHHEKFPLNESDKRSIYHVRAFNVFRMAQVKNQIDVFLSHDWPQNIVHYGDLDRLLRRKPFLRQEIERNEFGSPAAWFLLQRLVPRYWFSAHMHVKFAAIYSPDPVTQPNAPIKNPDEIIMSDDESDGGQVDQPMDQDESPVQSKETLFLALDKCLPHRDFLQIVDIPSPDASSTDKLTFEYDPEWLAIVKTAAPYLSLERHQKQLPSDDEFQAQKSANLSWVLDNINDFRIPDSFTAESFGEGSSEARSNFYSANYMDHSIVRCSHQLIAATNAQTDAFCAMLAIENRFTHS